MWLSSKFIDLFSISKETVSTLREDLAATRAERDTLKFQLQVAQNQFDWLRVQVNTLQAERAALIDRAYGIRVPAPEILRKASPDIPKLGDLSSFEHVDEDTAKRLNIEHLLS